jgi:acetyltransferase-like isoleucine patch superfamily enzyme
MKSRKSTIETNQIGKNVIIQEYCVIRPNVKIGDNVIIHPHVTIYEGVEINDGVEIFSGAVIGKEPKVPNILQRDIYFLRKVIIGKNSSIGPNAIIYYDVEIGQNCLIGDAAIIREKSKIGNRCLIGWQVTIQFNVIIGDESILMAKSHVTGNSKIGQHVFFGVGVNSANDNSFREFGYDDGLIVGPTIEDFAKIGVGATLLPKIHIGENAVVAAGAVVTKNVKKNSLVMGIPARHIKFLNNR